MLFADGDGAAEQVEADKKEDEAKTGDDYDLRPDDIEMPLASSLSVPLGPLKSTGNLCGWGWLGTLTV